MMNMVKKIKEKEIVFENQAEKYLFHHPYIGFFLIVAGMPIFILLAVTICTAVIMLPISYFMGWL